jgi:hypothetical protein
MRWINEKSICHELPIEEWQKKYIPLESIGRRDRDAFQEDGLIKHNTVSLQFLLLLLLTMFIKAK